MNSTTRFGIDFAYPSDEIFLDSATYGKMPVSSIEKMTDTYTKGLVVTKAMYQESSKANAKLESCRRALSSIFHTESSQISFLPSKESAIINILHSFNWADKGKIITSVLEDHSLLAPLININNLHGNEIDYLSLKDEENLLDILSEKLTSKTDVVLLSSLTPTIGTNREWGKISKICKENDAIFILDISNSVGHENILLENDSPDIAVATGISGALGPQGIAFQILSKEINEQVNPILVGGTSVLALEETMYQLNSNAQKYEAGIINLAGIIGLTNSLDILSDFGFNKIEKHEKGLHTIVREKLRDLPNVDLYELEQTDFKSITTFGSREVNAHDIALAMEDLKGIRVLSGALCAHLFIYDLPYNSVIRLSTHLYNTEEEVKVFLETFEELINQH